MTVDDLIDSLVAFRHLYGGDCNVTVVDNYVNEYEIAFVERQKDKNSNNKVCIRMQVTHAIS